MLNGGGLVRVSGENVGNYAIQQGGLGLVSGNYDLAYQGNNLTITTIKTVNALSHYTDWTIGHVHAGALGWVAMISIGSLYHLIPKVFGRPQMHSIGLINAHFWLATIGTVLYMSTTAVCSSVAVATDWFMLSISPIRLVTLPRRSPARLAISTLSRL